MTSESPLSPRRMIRVPFGLSHFRSPLGCGSCRAAAQHHQKAILNFLPNGDPNPAVVKGAKGGLKQKKMR